jgi:hypothetical protein
MKVRRNVAQVGIPHLAEKFVDAEIELRQKAWSNGPNICCCRLGHNENIR